MLRRKHRVVIGAVGIPAALLIALLLAFAGGSATKQAGGAPAVAKYSAGADRESIANREDTPGEGPASGLEAYMSAQRTYPANVIPPAISGQAAVTFNKIANKDAKKGDPKADGRQFKFFGPKETAVQPGVLAFTGATNTTASRTTALVVSPDCGKNGTGHGQCTVWAGVAGDGVWRADNAQSKDPEWHLVTDPNDNLAQNSVGTLTLDPTDPTHRTIYLGTGEPNECSSGCEAGVGIYKSTDRGNHWSKLADACVDNATYHCVKPGSDAFLGRAVGNIVIDPTNPNHIFVGSALAVRGLSHVVAAGSTRRIEPGANEPGLYESNDGGATFTEVWDGAKPDVIAESGQQGSFGINNVELDPSNPSVVYVSAFDAGLWRRDAGAGQTAFTQLFKPQFFQGSARDRTMFALTSKNGHTRIYLTEGTQPSTSSNNNVRAANFWRTDLGDQAAASLLATQGACTSPDPSTHTFPAVYTGWQCLTSKDPSNPYFASNNFCTQQCWYDQIVYTPAGMPDTVYLLGSNLYGEQPCDTNGVGCGNGQSNGREVLYSTTAGDPDGSVTGSGAMRTFTDLSYDATVSHPPWCALALAGITCTNAPNGIHPDEHAIVVNPGVPTQIFEASDGGVITTSGEFADISSQCDNPQRSAGGPLTGGGLVACKRLLSRVPTVVSHVNKRLSSTLQFWNIAIDPFNSCRLLGGTQDNGTWSNGEQCNRGEFDQVNYGDGGNAIFDATHQGWIGNEFTSGFADASFHNGAPAQWVFTTTPIVRSLETIGFYWPQISDPNPAPGTHPVYEGAQHVWRSWAFGAGTPHQVPQDTTPNISAYEPTCFDLFTSGIDPQCGDFQPLGGPYCEAPAFTTPPATPPYPACPNTAGDLTGTAYGTDRGGGSISWLARSTADHGTLWAATSAGRIFVTHNADASDPAAVTWLRIDNSLGGGSPTRFPSSISVDPANPNHAWISYSGYNAVTPTTPGHVFSVINTGTVGGGTFANLNVEAGTSAFPTPTNDGDLPVADVVRDDLTHTLYVATDFGVLRGDNDGTAGWHVVAGLPRYVVTHLALEPSSREPTCSGGHGPCKRVLYAATHSQGIWKMNLGPPAHR